MEILFSQIRRTDWEQTLNEKKMKENYEFLYANYVIYSGNERDDNGLGGCPNLSKKRKTRDRSRAFQNSSEQLEQVFDNDLPSSAFAPAFYQNNKYTY